MTPALWLIVALIVALAVLLGLVGYTACVVAGDTDARLEAGNYADEAGDELP